MIGSSERKRRFITTNNNNNIRNGTCVANENNKIRILFICNMCMQCLQKVMTKAIQYVI